MGQTRKEILRIPSDLLWGFKLAMQQSQAVNVNKTTSKCGEEGGKRDTDRKADAHEKPFPSARS